jgi:hypothetical protein
VEIHACADGAGEPMMPIDLFDDRLGEVEGEVAGENALMQNVGAILAAVSPRSDRY